MKGLLKGLIGLTLIAFVVAWFGSPILTVRALTKAAEAGDEAALERLVDFPAFRDSLKDELTGRLMDEARIDPRIRSSGLGGLGMILAPMLLDGAVDALVTAPTVAAMVRTARVPGPTDRLAASSSGDDGSDVRQSYGYRDMNTFAVRLTNTGHPDQTLKLLLTRQGLFDWKLTGVDLPES
jgi:hypothetical protein